MNGDPSRSAEGSYTFTEGVSADHVEVLAVDDSPEFLDLTATFLERERDVFEVTTRTRADEAVEYLQDHDVDVVVSDYDMPVMNGLEFLDAVREEFPEVPFILFTGKGSEEIASRAISAGVTDYLQKEGSASQYSVLANRLINSVKKYRAQKALERSEKQFSRLVENSTDLISVVSEEGYFEYVSPSCEHLIGYSQEELVGSSVFNYVHPDDRPEVMERFFEAVEDPDLRPTVEFRLDNPDREWTVLESRGRNLLGDEVIDGFVVNTRDITTLKKRERELGRRNEQLETVQDVISHDIRNPLNVALGSLEMYQETGDAEHLDRIETALNRMDRLIGKTDVMTDQEVRVTDTEMVSFESVAEDAWKMVETDESTLHVDDSRRVEADRERLQQLLENLIDNAVEHNDGPVTCVVGTVEGGLYFEDTGKGIPENDRDNVFESGFTSGEKHTGFGLTIVEQIVDAHGWEIDVTEGAEGGARFEIDGVEFGPAVYD